MEANDDLDESDNQTADSYHAETWDDALVMHRTTLVGLVNERLAYVPQQIYDIYDWVWRLRNGQTGHDDNQFPEHLNQNNSQSDQGSQSSQNENAGPSRKRALADSDYGYRISFTNMQRMYLRQLQATMIKVAISLQFDTEKEKTKTSILLLEETLAKYVQAVRDHEYMTKFYEQDDDPFVASSERQHDQFLLLKAMQDARQWPGSDELKGLQDFAIRTGPWEKTREGEGPRPIGGTRRVKLQKTLWSRIIGAAIGGVFLVGPMWALVLKREVVFQLSLTTGLVTAFGLLMAWSMSTLEAVFTATLAYAAVLMVFVGVMMQELD